MLLKQEGCCSPAKVWRCIDFILSCTLYPAAVILVWRAVWQIMDLNDQPDSIVIYQARVKFHGLLVDFPPCLLLCFLCDVLQFHLGFMLKTVQNAGVLGRVFNFVLTRIFIIVYTVAGIAFWRGVWYILDLFNISIKRMDNGGKKYQTTFYTVTFLVSFFLLCWPLRSSRTLLSCPLQMSRDVYEDVFECPSLLDKKPPLDGQDQEDSWLEYLLDVSISLFIVQTLVIACWWGFSGLQDLIFGETGADILYILVGYGFSLTAYILQPSANFPSDGHHPHILMKIWSDLVVCIGFIGAQCVWRGLWSSTDNIISPILHIRDRKLNLFVQCLLGLLPLVLFFCTNISSARGVVVDRELRENTKDEDLITVDHFALIFTEPKTLVQCRHDNGHEIIPLLHKNHKL